MFSEKFERKQTNNHTFLKVLSSRVNYKLSENSESRNGSKNNLLTDKKLLALVKRCSLFLFIISEKNN